MFQKPQEAAHDHGKDQSTRPSASNNIIWAIRGHDLFFACHPDGNGASRITHVGDVRGTETAAGEYSWANASGKKTTYKQSMRVEYGQLHRLPLSMEYYFAARMRPKDTMDERRAAYSAKYGIDQESIIVPTNPRSLQVHVSNEKGVLLDLACLPGPLLREVGWLRRRTLLLSMKRCRVQLSAQVCRIVFRFLHGEW